MTETTIGPATGGAGLIAQPEAIKGNAGTGIFESASNLKNTVQGEDFSAMALTADGLAFGLDVLGMVLNPLGEIVKAGVGWLMEHVSFIREPLEFLTGDPKQIEALAKTWNNIAKELGETGQMYAQELTAIQAWRGDAAEAYKGVAKTYTEALTAGAAGAQDAAKGVSIAGVVVATTRAIVFDLIATWISGVITKAIIAAASAAFTFGGSVGAFIATTVAEAAILMGKLTKKVAKVMKALQKMAGKFSALGGETGKLARACGNAADKLDGAAKSLGRNAGQRLGAASKAARAADAAGGNHWTKNVRDAARSYDQWANPAAAGITGSQREGWGNFNDHIGTKTTKEGVKGTNDFDEEYGGQGG